MTRKKFTLIVWGCYGVAAIALFVIKRAALPEFYRPTFMGIMSLLGAAFITLPAFVFRHTDEKQQELIMKMQWVFLFVTTANALGDLGLYKLYKIGIEYDKYLHFASPALLTVMVVEFLRVRFSVSTRRALVISIVVILTVCFLWEGWEMISDHLFNTQLTGIFGQEVTLDTIQDLWCDVFGILLGVVLVGVSGRRTKI